MMKRYMWAFTLLFAALHSHADELLRDPPSVCLWLGQANPSTGASAYTCREKQCSCTVTSLLGDKKIQWSATGSSKRIDVISWFMYLDTDQEKQYFGDISSGALASWMKVSNFTPIRQAILSGASTTWENDYYTVKYTFGSSLQGSVAIELN